MSGDTQLESTHHVVVLLAAAVVVGGLAELVPATTVRVMTTAATTTILRTVHSYTTGAWPPVGRELAGRKVDSTPTSESV